jgi:UDP-N-acetylmuramate--alanine ligase
MDAAKRALARFTGVTRRFAFRGEARGVTFVDDYAHLPAEDRRHTWRRRASEASSGRSPSSSRTATPRRSRSVTFSDAFADADVVVVTGIYGRASRCCRGVSGRLIADRRRYQPAGLEVHYLARTR